MKTTLTMLMLCLLLTTSSAGAAVPPQISVQGVLRDGSGMLQSTPVTVLVTFYDAVSAGNKLAGPYTAANVPAVNGLFTVSISDVALGTSLAASTTGHAFIEISVGNDTFARQPVTSEVFALQCGTADNATSLGGKAASAYLLSSDAASTYLTTSGASAAYLTQSSAASTYLSQSSAASTYLTQSNAAGAYLAKSASAADSAKLGGLAAAVYQQKLSTPTCPAGSAYNAISADGATATCTSTVTSATNATTATTATNAQQLGGTPASAWKAFSSSTWVDAANATNGSAGGLVSAGGTAVSCNGKGFYLVSFTGFMDPTTSTNYCGIALDVDGGSQSKVIWFNRHGTTPPSNVPISATYSLPTAATECSAAHTAHVSMACDVAVSSAYLGGYLTASWFPSP